MEENQLKLGYKVVHLKDIPKSNIVPFANTYGIIKKNSYGKWKIKDRENGKLKYWVQTDKRNIMNGYLETWLYAEDLEVNKKWYREQRLKKLLN